MPPRQAKQSLRAVAAALVLFLAPSSAAAAGSVGAEGTQASACCCGDSSDCPSGCCCDSPETSVERSEERARDGVALRPAGPGEQAVLAPNGCTCKLPPDAVASASAPVYAGRAESSVISEVEPARDAPQAVERILGRPRPEPRTPPPRGARRA